MELAMTPYPSFCVGKKKKKHNKGEILGACAFTLVLMHF